MHYFCPHMHGMHIINPHQRHANHMLTLIYIYGLPVVLAQIKPYTWHKQRVYGLSCATYVAMFHCTCCKILVWTIGYIRAHISEPTGNTGFRFAGSVALSPGHSCLFNTCNIEKVGVAWGWDYRISSSMVIVCNGGLNSKTILCAIWLVLPRSQLLKPIFVHEFAQCIVMVKLLRNGQNHFLVHMRVCDVELLKETV